MANRRGFTLYETLLVLMMVTGLTVLVGFKSSQQHRLVAERAFWPVWQQMWTAGRQWAMTHHTTVNVSINAKQHLVSLYHEHHRLKSLEIPQSLELIHMNGGSGDIDAAGVAQGRTLEWHSRIDQRWIYQTFQMGGVIFNVEDEEFRRPRWVDAP
ncbi:type II secretion system protein [Levilactobacillus fujinensis]|uniref:Type II secretion system protein n=1 Tax=Levilactobacillus fujinensis TaxID=2486024 RepID=A0ABW1TD23_9LACO|nr:type II secretion system protein [Levilactobacillus fujinensis]